MRQLASSRRSTAALIILTAGFALCAFQDTLHPSAALGDFLNTWIYDNLVIAAGLICAARGISVASERLPWILMGVALLSWGIGDTVWTFTVAKLVNPPFPSYADIGYLAVYPPA